MPAIHIFRAPKDIVWGRGSFSHLNNIPGKRALIITDKSMTHLGVTARAEAYLREGGPAARIFDEVKPEPGIAEMKRHLEVPASYRQSGISKSAYTAKLETFVANAATFPATA